MKMAWGSMAKRRLVMPGYYKKEKQKAFDKTALILVIWEEWIKMEIFSQEE